jgi:hypothetical protein
MVRPAFQRDNILNSDERAASARKCLHLLAGHGFDMSAKDEDFYRKHARLSSNIRYVPSEPELQWLRDLVERYAQ